MTDIYLKTFKLQNLAQGGKKNSLKTSKSLNCQINILIRF